jgi:adenosylcobinamide-GDP ribazoletransferase
MSKRLSIKDSFKREAEYFFAALRFFTRLPVPRWIGHTADQLNHAARYFSLMGIIVGAIGAIVTYLATLILPASLSILLGMLATLLTTGAFHEDGLADAVDGFGGGWDKLRILEIMKDSRVGSYGAIAIALMMLSKFSALQAIASSTNITILCAVLVAGHAISRLASTSQICFLEYVRENDLSKSKPLAQKLSLGELMIAIFFGFLPCAWLCVQSYFNCSLLIALLLVAIMTVYTSCYYKRHIGGYTGDCLGASQQLTEFVFYAGLLCKFS